ncbi:uncharacterized protein LOC125674990 [Ostrea edulis]|uniref:uncharacterized protein LOC125674990 n=1 Tax=Ostrea edulis TaxID=37623 RepID=UPI0024AECBA8|nr:uncharacterized protein LOC125674990 [Ostrea edulis]
MNFSVCLLVALFGGTVAYPVWEKFLKNGGVVYVIKVDMDNKEEDSENKVTPMIQEHLLIRQVGEKDDTQDYPDVKDKAERNRIRRPNRDEPSPVENSEGEILEKERIPKNPGRRERKMQYKPMEGDKQKTFLLKLNDNEFRSSDILEGGKRNFEGGGFGRGGGGG